MSVKPGYSSVKLKLLSNIPWPGFIPVSFDGTMGVSQVIQNQGYFRSACSIILTIRNGLIYNVTIAYVVPSGTDGSLLIEPLFLLLIASHFSSIVTNSPPSRALILPSPSSSSVLASR